MQDTIVAETAVMPEGVTISRMIPVSMIGDPEGRVEIEDFVFLRRVGEVLVATTNPTGMDERRAIVGDTLPDGSVCEGAYFIREVIEGLADMTLMSSVPCTVHSWCRGHHASVLAGTSDDPDRLDASHHIGSYEPDPVLGEFEDSWARFAKVSDAGTPKVDITMELGAQLDADGIVTLAEALEGLIVKLRQVVAE